MLVAASAMSPASGASGRAGVPEPEPSGPACAGGTGGGVPAPGDGAGAFGSPIAGASAVGGS
ncbi:hypothetical protein J2S54_004157 [Streptomyces sp. DSM 42143]|nr:hypothetical protein [Streptomyces sp. DSM 42143]